MLVVTHTYVRLWSEAYDTVCSCIYKPTTPSSQGYRHLSGSVSCVCVCVCVCVVHIL